MVFDGTNFIVYTLEGDAFGASMSAVAFVPYVGEVSGAAKISAKTAKYAGKAWKAEEAFVLTSRYADDAAELAVRNCDEIITVFRGTGNYMENRLFNETGYLLSDAALPLAYEGKEIRTVFEETNEIHKKWLENFNGDEIVYAREHGLLGHELEKKYGLPRTLISVTTSESVAKRFAGDGKIFVTQIPRSKLIRQTISSSTEEEYLIRIGAEFSLYK